MMISLVMDPAIEGISVVADSRLVGELELASGVRVCPQVASDCHLTTQRGQSRGRLFSHDEEAAVDLRYEDHTEQIEHNLDCALNTRLC